MNGFKKLKFQSVIPQDILQAVGLLEKLGYEAGCDFSADDAAKHNGICAWDDGEITEGWLDTYSGFKQVTLEKLKEMVGDEDEVLWLNKETLEERYLDKFSVFPYHSSWVEVPEGATFATGDKDNLVFRKDGWYYENGDWVETNVLLKHFPEYKQIKLFWAKSEYLWSDSKGDNFTVNWEKVFGETLMYSVSKAVKQNKDSTMKNDMFTLERLLGCEVLFGDTLYHVQYIYHAGAVGHLVLETDTRRAYVSDFNHLTFFAEDGDELTFDEYVKLYYPCG